MPPNVLQEAERFCSAVFFFRMTEAGQESCSYSFFRCNPSDWLDGYLKLHIVELILSNCFFFSFQDNAITVPFIKKLITEWWIYATLSHFFGLNLSSPAICHIYLAAVDGQKTYIRGRKIASFNSLKRIQARVWVFKIAIMFKILKVLIK